MRRAAGSFAKEQCAPTCAPATQAAPCAAARTHPGIQAATKQGAWKYKLLRAHKMAPRLALFLALFLAVLSQQAAAFRLPWAKPAKQAAVADLKAVEEALVSVGEFYL